MLLRFEWSARFAALLLAATFASAVQAIGDEGPAVDAPGIRHGQEELLLEMFGKGVALPDACTLTEGRVEYTVGEATYACRHGEVILAFMHSSQAVETDIQTKHFAVAILEGAPPTSLLDELSARILQREDGFRWVMPPDPSEFE